MKFLRIVYRRWWQRPREIVLKDTGFFEEDESIEDIQSAFERGEKGLTMPLKMSGIEVHHNWFDGEPPWLAIDFNEVHDGQVRVVDMRGAEIGDAVRLYDSDDDTEATGQVVDKNLVALTPGDTK